MARFCHGSADVGERMAALSRLVSASGSSPVSAWTTPCRCHTNALVGDSDFRPWYVLNAAVRSPTPSCAVASARAASEDSGSRSTARSAQDSADALRDAGSRPFPFRMRRFGHRLS